MRALLRLLEFPITDFSTADHLAKTGDRYLETMHDARDGWEDDERRGDISSLSPIALRCRHQT